VRGTSVNPMTREEVVQKAHDLVDPILGRAACTKFIETILEIDKVRNVRELRPVLQPS
jgi:hypothetical protein